MRVRMRPRVPTEFDAVRYTDLRSVTGWDDKVVLRGDKVYVLGLEGTYTEVLQGEWIVRLDDQLATIPDDRFQAAFEEIA